MKRARPAPFSSDEDPAAWCAVLCVFFLALVWHRLGLPAKIMFDEVHYVPAARKLLAGVRANPEHPLLGKELIAAAIRWLGDKPLYWRVPSALFGAFGLYAFSRLMWFISGRAIATYLALVLVATDFAWFIQSRIAMLDMFMAALGMAGLWLFASAIRRPDQGRLRLAGAGLALGLAIGAKWSVVPAAMLPGLTFAGWKLKDAGPRFLWARDGGPVPGVTLVEAAVWLALVPALAYWATFWPAFHYTTGAIDWKDPVGWHKYMLQLQDSVVKLHPYRTVWYQWVGDWRGIWYYYERFQGVQRGVLLIGNPFSMIAGLAGLAWCVWAAVRRARWDAAALAALYAVSLAMWPISGKPIQFYYHYLLPGTFLMGCLALALDPLFRREDRWWWAGPASVAAAVLMFIYFYPIISAAELHGGRQSFTEWMWLDSWR